MTSFIVKRKDNGEIIGEFFSDSKVLKKFNTDAVEIVPIRKYLEDLNRWIKENDTTRNH